MKKIYVLSILFSCFALSAIAQLNTTLRDSLDYGDIRLNDVWGWHDEASGKEYALVGTRVGTSIVDVSNPDDISEVAFLPGAESTWRDLKTWGNFAYVTNEEANGLEVIDLSDLAANGNVTSFNWEPIFPDGDTLQTCHNLYIDENGYCYLAGCNANSGGMIIVDVFSQPGQPQFVSYAQATYSHDVYTRDNLMYSSEIGEGDFTVFDVTDKQNIIELGSSPTLFGTTHNAWLSDDGNTLFTTDEKADATVGSYDVSDPSDIEALDQFRPLATVGTGVIPHNTHVLNDYLVTSHYSDGGVIIDASEPDNLIEVANYDTFMGEGQGFRGCWGAYPFLPSGVVLLTDITEGLFVIDVDYQRACLLEGIVSDAATTNPIAFATAVINSAELNESTTNFSGEYRTGIATAGTYEVTYDAPGYNPEVISVSLESGITTIQNVSLNESARYNVTGTVRSSEDNNPIPFAQVYLNDGFFEYQAMADANGDFIFEQIFEEDYSAVGGAWGFEYGFLDFTLSEDTSIEIIVSPGYQDDFLFDLNWETNDASTGAWERAEPIETLFEERRANPVADLNSDFGTFAYVTGNGGGAANSDDVDEETVTLTSPPMDLTIYSDPFVRYQMWFFNRGADDAQGDDELEIRISNGTDEVVLQTVGGSNSFWQGPAGFALNNFIEITDNMRLIVETVDNGDINVTEAALDGFRVTEGNTLSTETPDALAAQMLLSPNPFGSQIKLDYQILRDFKEAEVQVVNTAGRLVYQQKVNTPTGALSFGEEWNKGFYFVQILADGKVLRTEKICKF